MTLFLGGVVAGIVFTIAYYGFGVLSHKFIVMWKSQIQPKDKDDIAKLDWILKYHFDQIIPVLIIIVIFLAGWVFGGLMK